MLVECFPWFVTAGEHADLARACPAELTAWRVALAYHRSLPVGDPNAEHGRMNRLRHRAALEAAHDALRAAWRRHRKDYKVQSVECKSRIKSTTCNPQSEISLLARYGAVAAGDCVVGGRVEAVRKKNTLAHSGKD